MSPPKHRPFHWPGDDLYERNWRHIDRDSLMPDECRLIQALVDELGGGRLLV